MVFEMAFSGVILLFFGLQSIISAFQNTKTVLGDGINAHKEQQLLAISIQSSKHRRPTRL